MDDFVDSTLKALHRKEVEKEPFLCQGTGTEVDARTAELYSREGNTDITELMVIDETTQCDECEHNAKGKSFCTCGVTLQESLQDAKHHFRKALNKNFEGCTDRVKNEADYQEKQPHVRNHGPLGQHRKWTSESPQK